MHHNEFTIAAACADLLFGARIRAAAEATGAKAILLSPRDDVVARTRAEQPGLVVLDLDARWLDAPSVIAALKAEASTSAIPVIAFGSHVRTEALAAARAAGADRVLPRSAFARQLPELLRSPAG